jgi:hypothetical protein
MTSDIGPSEPFIYVSLKAQKDEIK